MVENSPSHVFLLFVCVYAVELVILGLPAKLGVTKFYFLLMKYVPQVRSQKSLVGFGGFYSVCSVKF